MRLIYFIKRHFIILFINNTSLNTSILLVYIAYLSIGLINPGIPIRLIFSADGLGILNLSPFDDPLVTFHSEAGVVHALVKPTVVTAAAVAGLEALLLGVHKVAGQVVLAGVAGGDGQ